MWNLLGNKSRASRHCAKVCTVLPSQIHFIYGMQMALINEKETFELVATVKPVLFSHSKRGQIISVQDRVSL